MAAEIVTRREGAVRWVGIDRPAKRNALTRELLAALVDAVAAAEREPEVRAVVVYGEGPVFSAGAPLTFPPAPLSGREARPCSNASGGVRATGVAVRLASSACNA